MRLTLDVQQAQTLEQQLDLPDKDKIQKAFEFWESKPHQEMTFPLRVMMEALKVRAGGTVHSAADKGLVQHQGEFLAEFVALTPAEISELDPDERYGVLLGDCIFVSDQVPDDYLPMVIANLGFLKRIGNDGPLQETLKNSGVDVDTSRHWTANILDIVLAEQHFGNDKEKMSKYLEWRKEIERTVFFRNGTIDDILRGKQRYFEYKRTTHPMQRAFMARRSWLFSGMLHQFGPQVVDANAKMLGIAKPDVIIRALCDRFDDQFDPEIMCRLIEFMEQNVQDRRTASGGRIEHRVDLNNTGDRPQDYAAQARLLTQNSIGDAGVLNEKNETNIFVLIPHYQKTLVALKDRIAYFLRQGLISSGMTRKMLGFAKAASGVLTTSGPESLRLTLGDGTERAKIILRKRALAKKIEEIDKAHDKFIALRVRFSDMTSVTSIPGELEGNYRKLLVMRDKLDTEMKELNDAEASLTEVEDTLREQRALLKAIVA